jgi:hypothetical protein
MNPKQATNKKVFDRLNSIAGLYYGDSSNENKHLDALTILSLPANLRKTALAIHRVTKGDVLCISKMTGKNQNIERYNLEELFEMGYLDKHVKNETIYYELI